MDWKKYNDEAKSTIKRDFVIMMEMLKNVDPNKHEISTETIPTLEIVRYSFIETIEKNVRGMLRMNALRKVLNKEELISMENDMGLGINIEESSKIFQGVKSLYM